MIALITGEKIRIDNHHENLPLEWDSKQDIHLHKISYKKIKGKQISVEAFISLNSDRGVRFDSKAGSREEENLRKEIEEAFYAKKNQAKCKKFIKHLLKEINVISPNTNSISHVKDSFNRIMECFGLDETIGELLVNEGNAFFQKYKGEKGKTYFIYKEGAIHEIGELSTEEKNDYKAKGFNL